MKNIACALLAALIAAASLPAMAGPYDGGPRHYRPDRRPPPVHTRPVPPPRRDLGHPGALWGMFGAGLALGAIAVAPPLVMAPVVPAPPPGRFWYYCESARTYHPYVGHCPEGWRAVPAAPY